jgi:hypothetical protein
MLSLFTQLMKVACTLLISVAPPLLITYAPSRLHLLLDIASKPVFKGERGDQDRADEGLRGQANASTGPNDRVDAPELYTYRGRFPKVLSDQSFHYKAGNTAAIRLDTVL